MKNKKYIISLSLLVTILFTLTGCATKFKNEDTNMSDNIIQNNKETKNNIDTNELLNNIQIQDAILHDKSLLTILKNNNEKDIQSLIITAIFYDENDEVVGTGETYFKTFKAGATVAVNDYAVPKKYARYDIKFETDNVYVGYESYIDKINITSKNTGEKVMVTAINESNVNLQTIDIGVVFYNQGIPVGFMDGIELNVKKGATKYFNIMYPYDNNYENIKFDEHKVFVNSAYETY